MFTSIPFMADPMKQISRASGFSYVVLAIFMSIGVIGLALCLCLVAIYSVCGIRLEISLIRRRPRWALYANLAGLLLGATFFIPRGKIEPDSLMGQIQVELTPTEQLAQGLLFFMVTYHIIATTAGAVLAAIAYFIDEDQDSRTNTPHSRREVLGSLPPMYGSSTQHSPACTSRPIPAIRGVTSRRPPEIAGQADRLRLANTIAAYFGIFVSLTGVLQGYHFDWWTFTIYLAFCIIIVVALTACLRRFM